MKEMEFSLQKMQYTICFSSVAYRRSAPLLAIIVQHSPAVKNKKSSLPVTSQIGGTFREISLFDGLYLN